MYKILYIGIHRIPSKNNEKSKGDSRLCPKSTKAGIINENKTTMWLLHLVVCFVDLRRPIEICKDWRHGTLKLVLFQYERQHLVTFADIKSIPSFAILRKSSEVNAISRNRPIFNKLFTICVICDVPVWHNVKNIYNFKIKT